MDEKQLREKNAPIVAAMTDLELKVIGKMIHEEQYRRVQEEVNQLSKLMSQK